MRNFLQYTSKTEAILAGGLLITVLLARGCSSTPHSEHPNSGLEIKTEERNAGKLTVSAYHVNNSFKRDGYTYDSKRRFAS